MQSLTSIERICIEIKRRTTREKKVHVRLSVLIMLDEGFPHETIALCQGIDADTISNWKRKYESVSRDLDRYLADNYVAFQGFLADKQLSALDSHLHDRLYLNAHQDGDYMFETFGVDYSDEGVTAILHRLEFVCKKVKTVREKLMKWPRRPLSLNLNRFCKPPIQ